MRTRPPAVAGSFYPGDPDELRRVIDACLASAPAPAAGETPPKAVIAPHAGYVYSGPIAAGAYVRLAPLRGTVERIVLLGPAHFVPVSGLAVPSADAFATPLGPLPVDRAAIDAVSALPQVVLSDAAHAREHSLEVQLPFLQRVLGDFTLVPFAVGDATDDEVAGVLEALWGGSETRIVVSSDLSHDHGYEAARRLDAATCAAIEALRPERLSRESACGRAPICGLLAAARRHRLAPHTLDLRSSGDTAGPRDRVVGYGAWSFA